MVFIREVGFVWRQSEFAFFGALTLVDALFYFTDKFKTKEVFTMDHELLKKLSEANNFFSVLSSFDSKIANQERKISDAETRYRSFVKSTMQPYAGQKIGWTIGFCIMSIYLFGFILMSIVFWATDNFPDIDTNFSEYEVDEMLGLVAVSVIAVAFVIALVVLFIVAIVKLTTIAKIKKKAIADAEVYKNTEMKTIIEEANKKIAELTSERRKHISDNYYTACAVLPAAYRNENAAFMIEKYINDGRADNLKEAINLYEDYLNEKERDKKRTEILKQQELMNYTLSQIQKRQEDIKHQIELDRMMRK